MTCVQAVTDSDIFSFASKTLTTKFFSVRLKIVNKTWQLDSHKEQLAAQTIKYHRFIALSAHWMQLILDWTQETIKRACAHQEAEDRGHWVKRCHLLLGKVSGVWLLLWLKRGSSYHRARIPSPAGEISTQKRRQRRKNNRAHGTTLLTVPALRSHCRRRKSTFLSRAAFLPLLPQRPTDPPSASAVGWAPQQPRDLLPLSPRMSHNMHNAFLLLNYAQLLRLGRGRSNQRRKHNNNYTRRTCKLLRENNELIFMMRLIFVVKVLT
jgi:hypothetical protein